MSADVITRGAASVRGLARRKMHRADQAGQRDAADDTDDQCGTTGDAEGCEAAVDALCAAHSPSGVIDENGVLRRRRPAGVRVHVSIAPSSACDHTRCRHLSSVSAYAR